MSTTVSYKGNTIATLNNETKTLTTAGTWVEGNIEITDSGVCTNGVFYVYKSSNCTIHRIPILDVDDWTFDLTSLVSSGYLYGGYFSSFGGSSQDWTSSDLEEVTFTNNVYTDSLGTPYTATVANVWKDDIAYTACGIALTPVSNTIYYIKEVPNDYLRLQFIAMYNNSNVLTHLYMYTAIDDAIARYKGVIFNPVLECQTFALMINHNGSYLTPKSLFDGVTYPDKTISVSRGYLNSMSGANPSYGTIDLSNYSANDTLTITPSWVTLDNVNVYGVITATIDFGDFTDDSTTGIKVSYTLKTGDKISVYSKITTLSNLTVTPGTNSQTFTGATQYDGYKSVVVNAMPSGSATTPATTITANPSISVNSSTGLITATASASQSITPTVVGGYISSGTAGTVTVSGSNTSQLSIQAGTTITPNESEQTAVSAGKYTTGAVKVGAISSTYVGSGINRRDETDLTASGSTVTVPAGFYAEQETKSVASGTEGTPTATKGTVSNHSISVTPSVTNTTGYITGGTKTGTAVTVTASELASGNKEITQNGTNIDVVGYSTVSVAVPSSSTALITDTTDTAGGTIRTITTTDEVHLQTKTITPTSTQQTVLPDTGYDGFSSVIVGASSGGSPSATAHEIYFEFSDGTDTTIDVYYNDSLISTMITAYTPATYGQKTVTLAQLDGVTWYEVSGDIPLNTELVDYTAVTVGKYVDESSGAIVNGESWDCVTDYLPIDPSMTFTFISKAWYGLGFYNASKSPIRGYNANNIPGATQSGDYIHGTFTASIIPSNAAYVVLTGNRYQLSSTYLSLIRTA